MDATLIGAVDFKDLMRVGFTFNTDLKQCLDYIHDELLDLFSKAQKVAEDGIDATKQQVTTEQTELDNGIAQAKVQLAAAQAKWEAYQKSIADSNTKVINNYSAKIQSLQDAITNAPKAYNTAVPNVQNDLTNVQQHHRQVKLQAAQNDLVNAKVKATADIINAQNQVAAAQANLNRDFGSVEGVRRAESEYLPG